MKNVVLLWFREGKQITEKPGGAVCRESGKHGFEREDWEAIPSSTPTGITLPEEF